MRSVLKKVSVIVPTRNEERFIINTLESIMAQDYPNELLEVIVADGDSEDNTRELIEGFIESHPNVFLITNPKRVVPYALNSAIERSTGEVIIRLDAHSKYPKNYVSRLVSELERLGADNVGGVWNTTPANSSLIATAIALATSHPLGIGDASYRLGNSEIKQVDTVPYGCFPRDIFDRIGMFDTDLVRNQDDEFNARILKNGGKIYLIPDVEINYFARESIQTMMKMFYQYGLFKPLVNKKLGSPATVRQFIPPLFVLYLLTGFFVPFASVWLSLFWVTCLIIYLLIAMSVGFSIAFSRGRLGLALILPWIFPLIHISYGWGYIHGFILVRYLNKKPGGHNFSISR